MKKLKYVLLVSVMICVLSGCSEKTVVTEAESVVEENTEITNENQVEESVVTKEDTVESENQTITDMAGRELVIPTAVEKVFSVNNNGSILVYTLAPEKLVGWNSKLSDGCKSYLVDDTSELPVLGTLYGNAKEVNLETIIALDPDVIIFMDATINDTKIEAADELQDKLSTPVIMVDGNMDNYNITYEFVGEILGVEEKASVLSDYYLETYQEVTDMASKVSEEDKVTVYYSRGEDGLTTEVKGSAHGMLIDFVGAINVVESEILSSDKPKVSIEQVMTLNPEIILVGNKAFISSGALEAVSNNVGWDTLDAVKNGAVYETPTLPFNWFDRPPSVNRIIGMRWTMWRLYPEYYEGDIEADIIEYFELFYHVTLTSEDVAKFLK